MKPVKKNLDVIKVAEEQTVAAKPEESAVFEPELDQASSAAHDIRIETQNLKYIAGLLKQSTSSAQ